ncbi:MAG: DUF2953 domain-containing protein [Velocimicrobium sp.]
MHIILLVLKIIGSILLVVLSLLLFLIILCLFVPIRYQAAAEKQEKIKANATARWLFSILSAIINYEENVLTYRVSVFGITIYPRKKKKKRQHSKEKHGAEPDLVIMEVPTDQSENKLLIKKDNQSMESNEVPNKEQVIDQTLQKRKKLKQNKKTTTDKKSRWSQLKDKWVSFKERIHSMFTTIRNYREKGDLILEFLKLEENKRGLLSVWNSLKKILRHIIPTKIYGTIEFGRSDPCQTGQALGVIGILFSVYGKHIQVIPNFEQECLYGEIFIKGRVRMFTLLRISITLLVNEKFKKLKINFEKLKEVL